MNNQLTEHIKLAESNWMNTDFGDKRLNKRSIQIGVNFIQNPFVSPPKMFKNKKNLKGFYRLINSNKISHEKLISEHVKMSRENISSQKVILAIQDATNISIDRNYKIEGLYNIGKNKGYVLSSE